MRTSLSCWRHFASHSQVSTSQCRKMFIDPNAMLVLQEVSLDLLCDVCVEIGRERRLAQLSSDGGGDGTKKGKKSLGTLNGKVCHFASCVLFD